MRHWDKWKDGRVSQLFSAAIGVVLLGFGLRTDLTDTGAFVSLALKIVFTIGVVATDQSFWHGDVADRKMTAARLEQRRMRFCHEPRGPVHHRAYDLLVQTHVHAMLPGAVYPKRIVARRILSYLRDIGQGPETGVQHVYFGHTHRAVNGYEHLGVLFHNGGAPIGRSRYRILELDLNTP